MDSLGRIHPPEAVQLLSPRERRALGLVPIPHTKLAEIMQMNRDERVAWHVRQVTARLDANTRRVERNKRKAERRRRAGKA